MKKSNDTPRVFRTEKDGSASFPFLNEYFRPHVARLRQHLEQLRPMLSSEDPIVRVRASEQLDAINRQLRDLERS